MVEEIVIAVEPKMADLYEALMLYQRIPVPARAYEATNGVRAVALYCDLNRLPERAEFIYRKASSSENLWAYFVRDLDAFETRFYDQFVDSKIQFEMSPDLLETVFRNHPVLCEDLNAEDVSALREIYKKRSHRAVFDRLERRRQLENPAA